MLWQSHPNPCVLKTPIDITLGVERTRGRGNGRTHRIRDLIPKIFSLIGLMFSGLCQRVTPFHPPSTEKCDPRVLQTLGNTLLHETLITLLSILTMFYLPVLELYIRS